MSGEEVTDLTDGEESGAAAKGKAKAPKAPKAPKEEKEPAAPKEKKKVPKGEKSGGGAGGIIVIMVLILFILLGGLGATLYLDMFSSRTIVADLVTEPLLDVIIWLDPAFSSVNQRLRAEAESQERRFSEKMEDLDDREVSISLQEDVLDSRENLLDRRENDLNRREEQIIMMYERTVPLYRREPISEQDMEDMISISRTFSQMSPESAASILINLYDSKNIAGILYFMTERNSAAILAVMEPRYAAEITEIWLYN